MGESRRRRTAVADARKVLFDFAAPPVRLSRGELVAFARDGLGAAHCPDCERAPDGGVTAWCGEHYQPDQAAPRAVRAAILEVVGAAYPRSPGMGRADGRVWADWQEAMSDEAPTAEVTAGMVAWLRKHAASDDVRVQPGMAQWREALVEYLDGLLADGAPSPTPGAE